MPNRIIKESAFSSERIAALSDFEFRLWVGLITQADDLGRGDARGAILKGRVFPLRERVLTRDIDRALYALAQLGCITLYEVDGKSYYQFPNWAEHQRVRNVRARFPAPEEAGSAAPGEELPPSAAAGEDSQQSAAACGELPQTAATCGEARPESESETESESQSQNESQSKNESETKPHSKARAEAPRTPLDAALGDFAAARKAMKRPLTPKARELTLRELEKLAPGDEKTKIAILHQSIQRGWQGVFPLEEDKRGKGERGNVFFDIAREEGLL